VQGPIGPQGEPGTAAAQGDPGPPSPQGEPGPGTIMAYNTKYETVEIGATTTNYMSVSINVLGLGFVVVTARVNVYYGAGMVQEDSLAYFYIAIGPHNRPYSEWLSYLELTIKHDFGDDYSYRRTRVSLFVQNVFEVSVDGEHIYYLNGDQDLELVRVEIDSASMVAVFYPSTLPL
jgi:hypothetical protein